MAPSRRPSRLRVAPTVPADPPRCGALDHTPAVGLEVILEDLHTGQILHAKAAGVGTPIASLTKLMMALLVRERVPISSRAKVSAALWGAGATILEAGGRNSSTGSYNPGVPGIATVLYGEDEIRSRVGELGGQITDDYAGLSPVLISVLKGGAMFLADLSRAVDLPLRLDFMSISKYGGSAEGSGVVRILKDLDNDIGGEDVLVVEDIIDTGLTLSYLLSTLRAREPASLEVCTLLDKSARRIPPLRVRYRGFDCPDRFVVGYGLDHRERYRNLPFIVAVEDQAGLAEDPDALVPFLNGAPPEGVAL